MSGDRFKLSGKRLELLRAMRREQGLAASRQERIERRPEAESYPLSFTQQRLWFLDRLQPGSPAYNLPAALRLRGPLRLADLERALAGVVERHAALRSVFAADEQGPVQRILPVPEAAIPVVDLAGLPEPARDSETRRLVGEEARRPFDLARGPLYRFSLLRLGPGDHVALATVHHIAADAWSLEIFVRELTALYAGGKQLPDLPLRYVDFASWQRDWAASGGLAEQLAWWRERLAGAPTALELPTDRPRPAVPSFRGATATLALPRTVSAGLLDLARREGLTPFTVVFALFAELLRRHAGQDDLLIGTPVANRQRPEIEGLVGFFANTSVLRADLSGDPTFLELLGRARETVQGAQAHQDLPFEWLVEDLQPERHLGHTPLFQVMLVFQNASPAAAREMPGELSVSRLPSGSGTARIDLALTAVQSEDRLSLSIEYAAELFHPATARRLLARLRTLAESVVADPGRRLSALEMLPASERHQALSEWSRWDLGAAQPREEPLLHRLFEERVARGPERVALVWGDATVSYGDLNARANRLARRLRAQGVGPDSVVGLRMDRSPELMVAILAVLKAGGAYLPLDPEAPADRTAFMLADAGVKLVLDGEGPVDETLSGADLPDGPAADNLAYVIYTSGSTGKPKGVMVPHRAACATLLWRLACFTLTPEDCVLQNIAFTFDPSIWQIFGALLSGARLVPVPPGGEKDFAGLARATAREGVTITDLAPPMLEAFLEQEGLEECRRLRLLFAGGQALPAELADRFRLRFPAAALQNIYGPTEAAIDAATWTCAPLPAGSTVPIGRPVAGKRLLVLDERFEPVPMGVPGELYIGRGLARGYLGQPALTAERFVPDPWADGEPGARLYRTGDLVRYLPDGLLEFLGRTDRQVKIRGFRVELGEIEAALACCPGVRESAVLVREDVPGQPRIVGYFAPDSEAPATAGELRSRLRGGLPSYMVPAALVSLPALPRTVSGKVDSQALPAPQEGVEEPGETSHVPPRTELEGAIAAIWREVLDLEEVGVEDNFFDRGGHSLLLIRVHARLQKLLGREVPVLDLFSHPTISALARHLAGEEESAMTRIEAPRARVLEQDAIAVVGMAGRFPGAGDLDELWRNLREGRESVRFFSDEELVAAGVDPRLLDKPYYVKARGMLDGVDLFDAPFFDIAPREAEMIDPQHRLFLECAWHALEDAGYDPGRFPGAVGVFAGVSANYYALRNVLSNPEALRSGGAAQAMLGGDKDFLATRVSYKLNLRGPSFTVQTACSTSLVATHLACRALLGGECEMALAGGVSATVPQVAGYYYQEGGINSPDGHCRAFDAKAQGTLLGSGVGVVVLKRLSDALAAGDHIHAVIRGTAINNDGSVKVGYTAPSIEGQAAAIAAAQAVAGISADEIGYIEAHGTGTPLGDPIEIAALTRVFRAGTDRKGYCAIGSVKTNIGHLDAAAGVTGLIKTVLTLEREEIPPSLHFQEPNPRIDFAASPFFVNAALREWKRGEAPRRAGVSSFGIGGTNAHAVLEEAPAPVPSGSARPWQLLTLSARSEDALEKVTDNLARHLREHPGISLADAAYTLQVGRKALSHRRVVVARDASGAAGALETRDPERVLTRAAAGGRRPVAFLFPGQGSQHANMGRDLYETEPAFRSALDACAAILAPHLGGLDLRSVLYPEPGAEEAADRELQETRLAQPVLFAVEYALARLWMEWGVRPEAMVGHSLGEYVAACLAGVFSLEDALALVAARGRMMQDLPRGAMLAVPLPEEETLSLLAGGLSLAAVNAPSLCVVSGPEEEIEALRARLAEHGLEGRRLHTSHAFHSAAMDPVLEPLAAMLRTVRLSPPRIPYLSNLTGTWITDAEATDPAYWARHLRQPVRFAPAVAELLREPDRVLLEAGPGRALATLARRQAGPGAVLLGSLRHPGDEASDLEVLLGNLGRLWLAGGEVDWEGFHAHERRRRVPLPLYPFERQRYWIEPWSPKEAPARALPMSDWFSVPVWKEAVPKPGSSRPLAGSWLLFTDGQGLGIALAEKLAGEGLPVVTVGIGDRFEKVAENAYRLRPGEREDYDRLLAGLRGAGSLPDRIVHLWNVGGPSEEAAFYSLLWLAQALGEAGARPAVPVEITVVADGLCDVTGEEAVRPEKALLLGPVRVLPLEYPGVVCRAVDVGASGPDRLLEELKAVSGDPVVALRGRRRWMQGFERIELEKSGGLREEGVVLVTGGTGGIGYALAEHLARTRRARLVLVSRSGILSEDRVQALEALGAEVMVEAADVADADAMRQVLARAVERFGAIHGVVHAAGVPGGGLIQLKTREAAAAVLRAKVQGTLVLGSLLADSPLDLFVLCSSLASLLGGLGQVDYCAANAFLDAFAARGGAVAINWDRWSEVGMAAAREDGQGLLTTEGVEAFDRAVIGGFPRVVVSTLPLAALIERTRSRRQPAREARPAAAEAKHSRPELATPYVAPRSETERVLAGIWEEVLGIGPVGVHDDFHELGGHSLIALRVLSRVRQALGSELPLRAIFDAPTVAKLAVRILESETRRAEGDDLDELLARLEGLSDEEAEALLASGGSLTETGAERPEVSGD
ncbi:MAG TPA: amino acid adenylation domain-containing protein [Thermoanaerobaculia bacterium]